MYEPEKTVTTPLPLTVTASTGSGDVAGELRYDPADPFAVSLAIGVDGVPVVWTFARELLADGLCGPSGVGDLRIEPITADGVREIDITLTTDCQATLIAPRDTVVAFLVEAYATVPAGSELDHLDIDAELTALLA